MEEEQSEDLDGSKAFVLQRDLAEVHILLDNLSSNAETSIGLLTDRAVAAGLSKDWVEDICKISWPPEGSPKDVAEQAALLIRSKDFLNTVTYPASGMSIAFTVLVSQEEDANELRSQAEDYQKGDFLRSDAPTRGVLAVLAYPSLPEEAIKFRKSLMMIRTLLIVWLVVTCLLSWYVAYGNATLEQLAKTTVQRTEARAKAYEAQTAEVASATRAAQEAAPPDALTGKTRDKLGGAPQPPVENYCPALDPATGIPSAGFSYKSVGQQQLCDVLAGRDRELLGAVRVLRKWSLKASGEGTSEEVIATATVWANLLGTAVLPIFYGLLGAGAAIVRSISQRIKASSLTPRHLSLSLQQLALGAVVGACIGLFFGSTNDAAFGPVGLSGSGLSFIAGFGVEQVFGAMEALITRIFSVSSSNGGPARPKP